MPLSQGQRAPPKRCVLLALGLLSYAIYRLAVDTSAPPSLEQAGGSSASEVGPRTMLVARATCAASHFAMLVYMLLLPGFEFSVVYKRELGSRLQTETVFLSGFKRMYTFFTIWTYTAQGVYFALAATCSYALAFGVPELATPWVIRSAHYAFEMTSGCGFVVSVVLNFVIWTEKVREGGEHDLTEIYNLVMHNVNLLEILFELLLGALPISHEHAAIGILWGTTFICFAWMHAPVLARIAKHPLPGKPGKSRGNGGNFPYFFLDWTLPVRTQFACYFGLLGVLLSFYYVAMFLREVLARAASAGVPLAIRLLVTFALGSQLTRWKD